jgi:two-component system cell cycle response regulator DivK
MSDSKEHESAEAKCRVLVVDDYADSREMYAEYFESAGFEVTVAADGQEALDKARSGAPDAILMDLSLPVLDGWEATRQLKLDARTREIPVVAVSAHVLRASTDEAREAGCDDFVAKPALPQDVEERIRKLLRAKRRPGAPFEP